MVIRLFAIGAGLLLGGCSALSVVGAKCVDGGCGATGLICAADKTCQEGTGGGVGGGAGGGAGGGGGEGGGGGSVAQDAGLCPTGTCVVRGDTQNPESFSFEVATSIAPGLFGERNGFVYAARTGVMYAFVPRISERVFDVQAIATLPPDVYQLTPITNIAVQRFGFAAVGAASRRVYAFGPLGDGGYSLVVDAGDTTIAASGPWPHPLDAGVLVALSGTVNAKVFRSVMTGDSTGISSALLAPPAAACVWLGRLFTSSAAAGLGNESRSYDLPPNGSIGNAFTWDGGAWTHCSVKTASFQAFTAQADGGIGLYSVLPQGTCLLSFSGSITGPLAQGANATGRTLIGTRPGGITELLLAADGGCDSSEIPKPNLDFDGGYRALAVTNLDSTGYEDLVLITDGGLLRVEWR